MVPADLFFGLVLGEQVYGSRFGTTAREPIAPTKLTFGRTVLAIGAGLWRTFAAAGRAMFATRLARVRDADIFRLAAVANRSELLGFANQLANFSAGGAGTIELRFVGTDACLQQANADHKNRRQVSEWPNHTLPPWAVDLLGVHGG